MKPGAVLFDCDGVLVDSEGPAFEIIAADMTAHGLAITSADVRREFIGGTALDCWRRARAMGAMLPEGWVEDFYRRIYQRLAEGTDLMPGVADLLDALDRAGIPYAVGSNGRPEKMHVTLGQHPAILARFKGRLFSGQTEGRPKPAPDLYLRAAAALGVPTETCVVVEDSPTGAKAARAAGMRCFGLSPKGDDTRLAAEGATIIRDLDELPALLGL